MSIVTPQAWSIRITANGRAPTCPSSGGWLRLAVARPYFYRTGVGGVAPVDALLSLPPTVCSDLVRETAEELGVEGAYHKGLGVLRRLLALKLSTRTLQAQVGEDAPAVETFYAQQASPPPLGGRAALGGPGRR